MSFITAAMGPLAGIGKPVRAAFAKTSVVLKTFLAAVFLLDEGDGDITAVKGSEIDVNRSFADKDVVERAAKSSEEAG
jgi:hypothetical protein